MAAPYRARDRWSSGGPAEETVLPNAHPVVPKTMAQMEFLARKDFAFEPVCRRVVRGPAADAILDYARLNEPDIIVMQAGGVPNVGRSSLGHVTEEVLTATPCAVWLEWMSGRPDLFVKELANFGWWFTSEKFDERWSLETLLAILRLTKKAEGEMRVVKLLSHWTPRPRSCCGP